MFVNLIQALIGPSFLSLAPSEVKFLGLVFQRLTIENQITHKICCSRKLPQCPQP